MVIQGFQSGYQYSNVPAEVDQQQPQTQPSQGHTPSPPHIPSQHPPPTTNPQQHQARPYNPTYHEYPQTQTWNTLAGSTAPEWLISPGNIHEKRKRFMVGVVAVVVLLLLMYHPSSSSSATHYSTAAAAETSSVTSGLPVVNETKKKTEKVMEEDAAVNEKSSNSSEIHDDDERDTSKYSVANDKKDTSQAKSTTITSTTTSSTTTKPNSTKKESSSDTATITTMTTTTSTTTPKLTYLLTYPYSGTTYTIYLFQAVSHTLVATAHRERSGSDDHVGSNPNLPFWHNPNLLFGENHENEEQTKSFVRPTQHVLVQTNCYAHGLPWNNNQRSWTDWTFERECRTVRTAANGTVVSTVTDRGVWDGEERMLHLVRDPFSNVVSMSHAYWRREAKTRGIGGGTTDQEKFREFCKRVDGDNNEKGWQDVDSVIRELLQDVPCRRLFMDYLQWHTLAHRMGQSSGSLATTTTTTASSKDEAYADDSDTTVLDLPYATTPSFTASPSLTIYYEDYTSKTKTAVAAAMMAGFMGVEDVDLDRRPSFVGGKVYRDYFEEEEKEAVEKVARIVLAHDGGTWDLLKRYFE